MFKILIAEDDLELRQLFRHVLLKNGYTVKGVSDGQEALDVLEKDYYDLIISDIMMPNMDGYELVRSLRDAGDSIPVLMVTAKDAFDDMRMGFLSGTDDYMVKPIDLDELLLRIEAPLRRHKSDLAFAKAVSREGSNKTGDLEILFNRYEVLLRGKPVELTAKEFEILALLASSPGQVFTRNQIFEHIWGRESQVDENSITVFMRKIREKIEDNPSQPKYLLTVWRVGYKFAERV